MSKQLIDSAINLHGTRKRASLDGNVFLKRIKGETSLEAEKINFLAKCWLRRGEGWGKDKVTPEKGATSIDPVTATMAKLLKIIDAHDKAGLLCDLEPYFEDLKKYGISISIDAENPTYSKEVHDDVVQLGAYKKVVGDCNEKIKELGKEAEDNGFVTKNKFTSLASLAFRKSRGGDIEDSCQNQIKNALMSEQAFEYLNNLDLN